MAKLRVTKWNAAKLVARLPRVLEAYGDVIGPQLQQEISTSQFFWPNETLRRNGKLVESPRDIVDTGELLRSQTQPVISSGGGKSSLEIRWDAPYSERVRRGGDYGEFINNQGRLVVVGDKPPRDWVGKALDAVPPKPYILNQWKQLAGS